MGTIQLNTRETIEHLSQDFAASMVSGDIAGLVSRFYAKDARVLPNHMPEAVGHKAIIASHEAMAKQYGVQDLQVEITSLDTVADVTWVTGKYTLTFQPAGAGVPEEDTGKYLEIYRRQDDGSLRCILDCFNSDLPMPEPA